MRGPLVTVYPPSYQGSADVTVQIYTVSFIKIGQFAFPGTAWRPLVLDLQDLWGGRIRPGLYFVAVQSGAQHSVGRMLVVD